MANKTTITAIGLTVPALPDNAVAFVNAAAWNAYWQQAGFSCTIPVASLGVYGLTQTTLTASYNDPGTTPTISSTFTDTDNVVQTVALEASFDEVKAQLAAINANYKNLKAALVAGGFITQ